MKRLTLDVSRWNIYQHRTARGLDQVDVVDNKLVQFEDELFDRIYSGEDVETLPANKVDPKLGTWARGIHEQCNALPAFSRLAEDITKVQNESTRAAMAGMAVEQLMAELGPALKDVERSNMTPPKSVNPGEVKKFEDSLRRLCRHAVEKTQKVMEDLTEGMEALDQFGFGWQPGTQAGTLTVTEGERVRQIANALRTKPRMQRLAKLIGRFRTLAENKKKQKVNHGVDEIADVTLGSDLSRALPTELMAFSHPLRKLDLLRRLSEGGIMQYKMTGVEPKGKGPMVVCLDKSYSMTGDANDWATAVALALGDVAMQDGRVFAVISFTTEITHEVIVRKGEKLPLNTLDVACDGGTNIDVAYARALKIIADNPAQLKKADIVMITDGGSNQYETPALRALAAQMGVQTFGMAIGVNAECLKPWCDTVETIEDTYGIEDKLATQLFAA